MKFSLILSFLPLISSHDFLRKEQDISLYPDSAPIIRHVRPYPHQRFPIRVSAKDIEKKSKYVYENPKNHVWKEDEINEVIELDT
jgi:hypothetical protein